MDKSIKKRLVYHMYLPDTWRDSKVIQIHLNCLKEFHYAFTEAIFVISMDDANDQASINDIEHKIIDCGINNVTFKIKKNTRLCEAKTLNDEIVQKLDELDGLTFFAHSKGVGNELFIKDEVEMGVIKKWIVAMYYLSLIDVNEVESHLLGVKGVTYGSFRCYDQLYDNLNKWIYSGTFYWINCQRLGDIIRRENIKVRSCCDRFFSELWLGDALSINTNEPTSTQRVVSLHGNLLYDARDFYNCVEEYIKVIMYGYEQEELNKLFNRMIV